MQLRRTLSKQLTNLPHFIQLQALLEECQKLDKVDKVSSWTTCITLLEHRLSQRGVHRTKKSIADKVLRESFLPKQVSSKHVVTDATKLPADSISSQAAAKGLRSFGN